MRRAKDRKAGIGSPTQPAYKRSMIICTLAALLSLGLGVRKLYKIVYAVLVKMSSNNFPDARNLLDNLLHGPFVHLPGAHHRAAAIDAVIVPSILNRDNLRLTD